MLFLITRPLIFSIQALFSSIHQKVTAVIASHGDAGKVSGGMSGGGGDVPARRHPECSGSSCLAQTVSRWGLIRTQSKYLKSRSSAKFPVSHHLCKKLIRRKKTNKNKTNLLSDHFLMCICFEIFFCAF